MSAPLPASSTIPRSTAQSRITNSGQGHAAANLLPAVAHVKQIGRKVDETLKATSQTDHRRGVEERGWDGCGKLLACADEPL